MIVVEQNSSEEACTISQAKEQIGEINTKTLKILLQAKTNLVLVDARAPKWDDGRRIPGAKSLTDTSSVQEITSLLAQKNTLIVVYCTNTQCGASHRLAVRLVELGYSNILRYVEGIDEWVKQRNAIINNS